MHEEFLTRVKHIASELLPGGQIEAIAAGEGYYTFEITGPEGHSTLPPVWIDPQSSDRQIKHKLFYEFRRDFHPAWEPDDLSVPNLQGEAK